MFLKKNWLGIATATMVTVGFQSDLASISSWFEVLVSQVHQTTKDEMPAFWKDLRGKGFTKEQIAATALEYSQTHLIILTALEYSPRDLEFGALIRKVVQEQIDLGRVNIMVMVIEKDKENVETGMEFVVKGKTPTGIMSTDKAPEVSMNVGIEVFYDGQSYPKVTD